MKLCKRSNVQLGNRLVFDAYVRSGFYREDLERPMRPTRTDRQAGFDGNNKMQRGKCGEHSRQNGLVSPMGKLSLYPRPLSTSLCRFRREIQVRAAQSSLKQYEESSRHRGKGFPKRLSFH
jgi:hypothetical protein